MKYCIITLAASCWLLACAGPADVVGPEEEATADLEDLDPENPDLILGGKADQQTADWPANGAVPDRCEAKVALQALFAPEDPTASLELAMIDRVREKRAADPGTYAEGESPFRIRYAVYNLTHSGIITRLLDAEREGVDVQVLIEADQLGKPWIDIDDRFRAAGLEVHLDHHALGDAELRTADLIGIEDRGLMHLKARLYEAPGFRRVLTGSMNPNQSAGANEESLHLIADPAVIDKYAQAQESVLTGTPLTNSFDEAAPLNVMFTPVQTGERAATRILEWVEAEDEQILLMVFSLRNVRSAGYPQTLFSILKAKHEAGVPVYVITDRKQSDGVDAWGQPIDGYWDDWFDDALRDIGIPVWECLNLGHTYFGSDNPYAAMHQKAAVLGRTHIRVITDAANWTRSGLGNQKGPARNVESVLFIDSERLDGGLTGRRYLAQWLRVLSRYAHQAPEQPGFWEVQEALSAQPGWPQEWLGFRAHEAHTDLGDDIRVLGSLPELGEWGDGDNFGVLLTTDGFSYPSWWSPEPVVLPLGVSFEWKLSRWRHYDLLEWERGDNRQAIAAPPVCPDPDNPAMVEGTWQ